MNIKFAARAVLVVLAVLMALMIVVGIGSCVHSEGVRGTSTPNEATIETTTFTMQVMEYTTVTTDPLVEAPPALYPELEYKTFDSLNDTKALAETVRSAIETLTYEYENGTYSEDHLDLIRKEKVRLEDLHNQLLQDITKMEEAEKTTQAKPSKKNNNTNKPDKKPSTEVTGNQQSTATPDEPTSSGNNYKYATIVWNYLRREGYSNAVCAGIMGNFMTETGGHTLNIKPTHYSSSGRYYGIAQWSIKYYPQVQGKDLDGQLAFLSKTIEYEFNTFGHLYKNGFDYNDFLQLDSPREAALAFAKVYERCGSGSYNKRQNGAEKAYDYFT